MMFNDLYQDVKLAQQLHNEEQAQKKKSKPRRTGRGRGRGRGRRGRRRKAKAKLEEVAFFFCVHLCSAM